MTLDPTVLIPTPNECAALGSSPSSYSVMRLALLNTRSSLPPIIRQLLETPPWAVCEHIDVTADDRPAALRRFDASVLFDRGEGRPGEGEDRVTEYEEQLALLQRSNLGVLVITRRPWQYAGSGPGVVCLPPDASLETAYGALLALSHMSPILRQIDRQVDNLNRLSQSLKKQFDATHRELQLASRLQRDFLPREMPHHPPIRFGALFRPCTWVSGDIFDVARLDEFHWAFYVIDAVGHGVAAGLLTMYVKQAIRPKIMRGNGYELLSPAQVLNSLNDQLIAQELPDSQFITAWYGQINTKTLELRYAVAGHPPAMLIGADGSLRELHGDGGLLGLATDEPFTNASVTMRPGERLFVYSDGLEPTLIADRLPLPAMPSLNAGLPELLRLPMDEVIPRLRERVDAEPGSLDRADDVTVLVLDVEPSS